MRSFPSDALGSLNRQRTLPELDAPDDHEPLFSAGVLARIGLLLFIVFTFAMVAQLLVGAPH